MDLGSEYDVEEEGESYNDLPTINAETGKLKDLIKEKLKDGWK